MGSFSLLKHHKSTCVNKDVQVINISMPYKFCCWLVYLVGTGGQSSLADYCTYFVAYSDGSCTDTNSVRTPDRMLGEVRGSSSRWDTRKTCLLEYHVISLFFLTFPIKMASAMELKAHLKICQKTNCQSDVNHLILINIFSLIFYF